MKGRSRPYPQKPCPLCDETVSTHWKPWRNHMAQHIEYAGERSEDKDCYVGNTDVIISPQDGRTPLEQVLGYAVTKGVVAVEVGDPKMFKKSRVGKQVLLIVMGCTIGDPRAIMFALVGGGCEVCRLHSLKVSPLIRTGLSAGVAKSIIDTFKKVLSEHGYEQES